MSRAARIAMDAPPLAYALRWRVAGVIPGAHAGRDEGQSGRFREVVPFDRSPDPRRIDLRASARDPFGQLHVRQFEQRAAATVEVVADLSASMAFGPAASATERAKTLVHAIAEATQTIHDSFGLVAAGARIEMHSPARRNAARALAVRFDQAMPWGQGIGALLDAAKQLIGRRRLVFLISDFAFPLDDAAGLLDALAAHDVVPVVIGDAPERLLPAWGLARFVDLESGAQRTVVLRPALRARWQRAWQERRARLASLCAARGRRPFFLDGAYDAHAFADHLLAA